MVTKGGAGSAAAGPALVKADSALSTTNGDLTPKYPEPAYRCLRGYAIDPSLQTQLTTEPISTVLFKVPWESLEPGPMGEYLEVVDFDPTSKCFYDPVDLEDHYLLAQDGLAPSQGVPQFHQQMVYAVASATIQHFERALGRRAQWRPGPPAPGQNSSEDSYFVRRLRIYPHALREANAYYSPQKIALLFGYYPASTDNPGSHIPGGIVFTCLSYDIVAHETSHALLDGMHRSYTQPTNPDMQAMHEAFADIVAMFQHFTYPELVKHQIANVRGEMRQHENLLSQLAGEFGRSTGMRGALRDAIGSYNGVTNQWEPHTPDPTEYEKTTEPHARGALLVAAVFDAFLSIYERRTQDLLRIATNGTGVLPAGALHPDLVGRLSEEVSKAATHTLEMCIRALDYCPPKDLTFGEFLRALITADRDIVPDDDLHYRVAFIEAFRHRGIYPRDLRTLSEESLTWRGPDQDVRKPSNELNSLIEFLRPYADRYTYAHTREEVFHLEREMRRAVHDRLEDHFNKEASGQEDATYLGLSAASRKTEKFEVRSARFSNRVGPDGQLLMQCIIELLQKRTLNAEDGTKFTFEGGSTVIADLRKSKILYCVRKDIDSKTRLGRQLAFQNDKGTNSLRETYFGFDDKEPFAFLHRG